MPCEKIPPFFPRIDRFLRTTRLATSVIIRDEDVRIRESWTSLKKQAQGNDISRGTAFKRDARDPEEGGTGTVLKNGALNILCRTTYRGCRCVRGRNASPAPRPRPRAPLGA